MGKKQRKQGCGNGNGDDGTGIEIVIDHMFPTSGKAGQSTGKNGIRYG